MPQAQANDVPSGCTNASLNSAYGFYRTGTNHNQGTDIAAVGIGIFDGNGVVSGHQTTSRNGVFATDPPLEGPYQVNADCTGQFLAPNGTTVVGQFALVDSGTELYFLSMTPGDAVTGVAKQLEHIGGDGDPSASASAPAPAPAPTLVSNEGGGGCTLHPGAAFDPTLVCLLGLLVTVRGLHALRRKARG